MLGHKQIGPCSTSRPAICSQYWGTWPRFQIIYCLKNQSQWEISQILGGMSPCPPRIASHAPSSIKQIMRNRQIIGQFFRLNGLHTVHTVQKLQERTLRILPFDQKRDDFHIFENKLNFMNVLYIPRCTHAQSKFRKGLLDYNYGN